MTDLATAENWRAVMKAIDAVDPKQLRLLIHVLVMARAGDLRRLRAHQIIERIPHSRAYQVTEDGLTIALFLTRLTQRLLIPGLAQLTSPGPPGRSRLRQADRAYRDALTDLARQAPRLTSIDLVLAEVLIAAAERARSARPRAQDS